MTKLSNILPSARREREELEATGRCPNEYKHVSAWPAFDRKPCPYCGGAYVRKIQAGEKKE